MKRHIPQDIRAFLPVEELVSTRERAERKSRRIMAGIGVAGWVLFVITLGLWASGH